MGPYGFIFHYYFLQKQQTREQLNVENKYYSKFSGSKKTTNTEAAFFPFSLQGIIEVSVDPSVRRLHFSTMESSSVPSGGSC